MWLIFVVFMVNVTFRNANYTEKFRSVLIVIQKLRRSIFILWSEFYGHFFGLIN